MKINDQNIKIMEKRLYQDSIINFHVSEIKLFILYAVSTVYVYICLRIQHFYEI